MDRRFQDSGLASLFAVLRIGAWYSMSRMQTTYNLPLVEDMKRTNEEDPESLNQTQPRNPTRTKPH